MTPVPSIITLERPPLVEVVCGVQFEPLADFHVAHAGLFWQRLRSEYPHTEEQPPIIRPAEPDSPPDDAEPAFELQLHHIPRLFFVDEPRNRVLQLQADRFFHNWRKVKDDDVYPRYQEIRAGFLQRWNDFRAFVGQEKLGTLQVRQYELSYVNIVPAGTLWSTPAELANVLTFARSLETPSLSAATDLSLGLRIPVAGCKGILALSVRMARRRSDKQPVALYELTLRGRPRSQVGEDLESWLDAARQNVVSTFADSLTERAQRAWGMQR